MSRMSQTRLARRVRRQFSNKFKAGGDSTRPRGEQDGRRSKYVPTGTDLSGMSQTELNAIARRLNTRPRRTLGYRTPGAMLTDIVASTG